MKNLVISRKGFDATAGGRASPIFANGDIFSVPIPQKKQSPSRYKELQFNNLSGHETLNLICSKWISDDNDPLLSGLRRNPASRWWVARGRDNQTKYRDLEIFV